jgi:hypothetical protein
MKLVIQCLRNHGAPDLNPSEMQYLYRTLIDIILRISETERIKF